MSNRFVISFARMICKPKIWLNRILPAAFLVCFSVSLGFSQQVVSYSITEGLLHNNIRSIFHAPDGYLWIGTWDGLSRFDGHSFYNYQSNPGDSTSIADVIIQRIAKDNNGYIWVITGPIWQIARYEPSTDNFKRLELPTDKQPSGGGDSDLAFDNYGNGWLINEEGLFCFDPISFSHRFIDISDFHLKQSRINTDKVGLWIASTKGLFLFSYQTLNLNEKITTYDAVLSYHYKGYDYDKHIQSLVKTQNGSLVVATSDVNGTNIKLFITPSDTNNKLRELPFPHFHQPHNTVQSMYISKIAANKILVSTDYPEFAVFDTESMDYEYNHPVSIKSGSSLKQVAYPDHQHNLWVGGLDGIYRYTKPQLNFRSWTFDPTGKSGLRGQRIFSIFKDNQNRLWVGSKDGGLESINLQNNRLKKIIPAIDNQLIRSTNNVTSIIPLNDEELLVNFGTSLLRYHIPENNFSFFKTIDFVIYSHLIDSHGRIWISERGKLVVLDNNDYSIIREIFAIDFAKSPINSRQIFEAQDGQFWICCGEGLVKLNYDSPQESTLFVPTGSESDPEVICMHECQDGTFWLGTLRHGIYAFDPLTETFGTHFSAENGLIDNSVNKIYEDKNGLLWMSTWKGLARLNTTDGSIYNYSTVNGLPFPEFNTNAHFMDKDGIIYFGGEGGVVSFHPDSLVNFELTTMPGITSINAGFGLMPLNYPLRDGDKLELPYDQNSFTITFSAFDLRHPAERLYRYRMAGWRNDWQLNRASEQIAYFAGLNPGNYSFQMQTTYKGWPWILEEMTIAITISNPPFYKMRSFQMALIIALGLSVIIIFMMRIRNKAMQREVILVRLEREANQYRLNFLKSQMNPHFYFNTLNSINSYILKNDMRSANKFLTTFAKLMREILENSQREFITVEEEKEVLEKYISLQQLRFQGIFEYRITIEDQVKPLLIPPMLVQPFVENAIEYAFVDMTFKGIIHVNFELINKSIVCTITDNGIGIQNSQKLRAGRMRKSAAIKNIGQRIEMLNKIFKVSIQLLLTALDEADEKFPGTQVRLIIPLLSSQER